MTSRFTADGETKYLADALELVRPERNTLTVSYEDVDSYNQQLSTTIVSEYYRFVIHDMWVCGSCFTALFNVEWTKYFNTK